MSTTKTGRTRRMTLTPTTIAMIDRHAADWPMPAGAEDWMFAVDPTRREHVQVDVLSKRFARLAVIAAASRWE